ncbi:hypothetical protein ACLSZ7_11210 [Avibacterium gallinarum]|uniref:hypothetical protein n=1 Tax=Avibacterium gallinarum TaxID=755 RepID=UPI003BF7C405
MGEVLSERNELSTQSADYPLVSFTVENGVTPKTERYEREQLVKGNKKDKKYKVTRLNDIVYNPANLKFGAISKNQYGNAVFSPIYVTFQVIKGIADSDFVELLVTRENFIQYALKFQQGTVYERQAVNPEDFLNLHIFSTTLTEQQKIGNLFKQLDRLITLHK